MVFVVYTEIIATKGINMTERAHSKFLWIVVGAIVGGAISFSFDKWLVPYFAAKSEIKFSATSEVSGSAKFTIVNSGDATAKNISVTIWATAPFSPKTDIVEILNIGGVSGAECNFGIYQARLMARGKSKLPNALNTEAKAALIQCDVIRPGEKWNGKVTYVETEAVFGLMAHVKDNEIASNLYGRFAEGGN
ncbi:MAG: hypothetical protein JKY96_02700 [Phycisphaerales bacterium]|nr:hypothetical protein [Phycisphaerales bacterium]